MAQQQQANAPAAAAAPAPAPAATNTNPPDPLDIVRRLLTHVFPTDDSRNRFIEVNQITCLGDLRLMKADNAASIIKVHNDIVAKKEKLGATSISKLQGFLHWHDTQLLQGKTPDPSLLSVDGIVDSKESYDIQKARGEVSIPTDSDPGPIVCGQDWFIWKMKVHHYLLVVIGVSGIPLLRIIREDKDANWQPSSEIEGRVYLSKLSGKDFDEDNEKVYTLLVKWCCGNAVALSYIENYKASMDGRSAWLNILVNVEGVAANSSRLVKVTAKLSENYSAGGLCYYGENQGLSWAKYSSGLASGYLLQELLLKQQTPTPTETKVRRLVNGIQTQNQLDIQMGKNYLLTSCLNNWDAAVNHMATQVAIAYPNVSSKLGKRKDREAKESNSDRQQGRGGRGGRGGRFGRGGRGGRWGRGRGRGGGRGGRGGRGNDSYFKGVDISDPTREFTDEEYAKLGRDGRFMIKNLRRAVNKGDRGNGGPR